MNSTQFSSDHSSVHSDSWGTLPSGQPVKLFTLKRGALTATISNYGGIVQKLLVPDRNGVVVDVVLGYETLEEYVAQSPYFGCLIGRFGNRIGNGQFTLDGTTYSLLKNDPSSSPQCHLHGGLVGFDKKVWEASEGVDDGNPYVDLSLTSPDGDEGYPGDLVVKVRYTLLADMLRIEYRATTTKPTPVNLTNHSYFNLKGEGEGTILDHEAKIESSHTTHCDQWLIPTGNLTPVAGTPFDFRDWRVIGDRIEADDEQMKFGIGYDHNYALDKVEEFGLAASVREPASGRVMEVWTTEPGIQFYVGNHLPGTMVGKSGRTYLNRSGICLETQHYPDSPNHPEFPNCILRPGENLYSKTEYRFSTE
ncbi:MAG: galactose mutarotase [Armatimonadetes bacterium]|nr:galactose mutarotase [Armatimonadota bacterium]